MADPEFYDAGKVDELLADKQDKLTQAQIDAIDSGIDADKVAKIEEVDDKRDKTDNVCHSTGLFDWKDGSYKISGDLEAGRTYSVTFVESNLEVRLLEDGVVVTSGTLQDETDTGIALPLRDGYVLVSLCELSKLGESYLTKSGVANLPAGGLTDSAMAVVFATTAFRAGVRYPVETITDGNLKDRTVNILTIANNQTINAPTAFTNDGKTYARDFVVRVEVGATAPTGYTWGFTPEVKDGDSWNDMSVVEANKKYIYRFTDCGGGLVAAREEVA